MHPEMAKSPHPKGVSTRVWGDGSRPKGMSAVKGTLTHPILGICCRGVALLVP